MKSFLGIILLAIGLASCNPFVASVSTTKELPPLPPGEPVYIFFSAENIPDSAVLAGTMTVDVVERAFRGDAPVSELIVGTIEKAMCKSGVNLLAFDDKKNRDSDNFIEGKVYLTPRFERTGYTEDSLLQIWKKNKPDYFEGIYETDLAEYDSQKESYMIKYAIIKIDSSQYKMIYLSGFEPLIYPWGLNRLNKIWQTGDVYAYIKKSNKANLFTANSYKFNKSLDLHTMIRFIDGGLRIQYAKDLDFYRKVYPDSSKYEPLTSSLTGFALDKNRILTCYHGVKKDECKIYIRGINGDYDKKYTASVESFDKANDIAILKLIDDSVKINFNLLAISSELKNTAEEISVLGYPISSLMGDEIKITNGIINSTSGIGGNPSDYQISAPIQPGSSGSPLFDKSGNLIGMITSGISNADNVGYALKSSILKEFLSQKNIPMQTKPENTYKDNSLTEKVKIFQNSIYIIELVDTKPVVPKPKKNKSRR